MLNYCLLTQTALLIGKMKDEFGGVIVVEFVGLKSKMHSMEKN